MATIICVHHVSHSRERTPLEEFVAQNAGILERAKLQCDRVQEAAKRVVSLTNDAKVYPIEKIPRALTDLHRYIMNLQITASALDGMLEEVEITEDDDLSFMDKICDTLSNAIDFLNRAEGEFEAAVGVVDNEDNCEAESENDEGGNAEGAGDGEPEAEAEAAADASGDDDNGKYLAVIEFDDQNNVVRIEANSLEGILAAYIGLTAAANDEDDPD